MKDAGASSTGTVGLLSCIPVDLGMTRTGSVAGLASEEFFSGAGVAPGGTGSGQGCCFVARVWGSAIVGYEEDRGGALAGGVIRGSGRAFFALKKRSGQRMAEGGGQIQEGWVIFDRMPRSPGTLNEVHRSGYRS